MKAYSHALWRALLAAYEHQAYSQRHVAERFGVSPATVRNLVRRKREPGTPDAWPRAGGKRAPLGPLIQDRVRQLLAKRHDRTLAALCTQIAQAFQTRVRVATLGRLLQRFGLPRKTRRSTPRNAISHASSRRA